MHPLDPLAKEIARVRRVLDDFTPASSPGTPDHCRELAAHVLRAAEELEDDLGSLANRLNALANAEAPMRLYALEGAEAASGLGAEARKLREAVQEFLTLLNVSKEPVYRAAEGLAVLRRAYDLIFFTTAALLLRCGTPD